VIFRFSILFSDSSNSENLKYAKKLKIKNKKKTKKENKQIENYNKHT